MEKQKKKVNPLAVIAVIILTILSVITLAVIGFRVYNDIAYRSFYKRANKEFIIPGTNDGFVGQGLDYLEEQDAFLACGYSAKKGGASMVYCIDADGNAKKTLLKNADGSNYTGHTGGIAHYKEYVYVTAEDGCDVFALSDFLSGNGESKMLGDVKTPLDPAYCTIRDGKFYTGSFYRAGNFETPYWQRTTTPAGDENKSVITVFAIDNDAEDTFYIKPDPIEAFSTASLVQGITFIDNQAVLSTSYAMAASHLNFYDVSNMTSGEIEINGKIVPLYYLDSHNLTRSIKAPPMSEETVYRDGKIYIMTESASNKYIFGKFTRGKYLWSYEI